MNEALTDEALLAAHLRGDGSAFATLFDRHQTPVFRYLLRQLRAQASAEDVLQDTFMTVLRQAEQFRASPSSSGFRAWLFTIARSRLVDHVRRQGREASVDDPGQDGTSDDEFETHDAGAWLVDPAPGPEAQVMSHQQARALAMQVEALPGPQRDAFLLHAEAGMSVPEIARTVGVPTETAKSRLRYALARLRNAMEALS
jgi:RNA polymerase sigma-70 factor (ECF subfamily)